MGREGFLTSRRRGQERRGEKTERGEGGREQKRQCLPGISFLAHDSLGGPCLPRLLYSWDWDWDWEWDFAPDFLGLRAAACQAEVGRNGWATGIAAVIRLRSAGWRREGGREEGGGSKWDPETAGVGPVAAGDEGEGEAGQPVVRCSRSGGDQGARTWKACKRCECCARRRGPIRALQARRTRRLERAPCQPPP